MTAHFLKIARLSTVFTLVYFLLRSVITILLGETPSSAFTFHDVLIIAFPTIILSYALIDSATLAGVVRLNVGSFTLSLRQDITKPLILYDDEWNTDCLKVREALSSLGIPAMIHPVPKLSSNTDYFHNYPIESRFVADAIMHHPQLKLVIPLLYDPNTGAVIFGDGEHINNYIFSTYSKRLTDVDPPPPLTIGPIDLVTSLASVNLRKGSVYGAVARPSIYNKSPLHLYACQSDGPSRIIREWLCRLQLSYILFPTSRGAIYRAVLLHQVGSFYHSHRSRLVYERFNILASYEHQRKQLLETINSEEFNAGMDQIDWLEKVSGGPGMSSGGHSHPAQTPSNRTLDQPTHTSQQTIVLQDPNTNGYTVMRGGTVQANFNEDDFFSRLQHHGYPVSGQHSHHTNDNSNPNIPLSNHESPRGDLYGQPSNLNGLGHPDFSVDDMYRNKLHGDNEAADDADNRNGAMLDYLYAVDNTPVGGDDPQQQQQQQHRPHTPNFTLGDRETSTISVVDDGDHLPVLNSIKHANKMRNRFELAALGENATRLRKPRADESADQLTPLGVYSDSTGTRFGFASDPDNFTSPHIPPNRRPSHTNPLSSPLLPPTPIFAPLTPTAGPQPEPNFLKKDDPLGKSRDKDQKNQPRSTTTSRGTKNNKKSATESNANITTESRTTPSTATSQQTPPKEDDTSTNVDERLLMTSLSTFQRSVGLTMLYDPNTEITAFGLEAVVRYIRTLYSFDTSVGPVCDHGESKESKECNFVG